MNGELDKSLHGRCSDQCLEHDRGTTHDSWGEGLLPASLFPGFPLSALSFLPRHELP